MFVPAIPLALTDMQTAEKGQKVPFDLSRTSLGPWAGNIDNRPCLSLEEENKEMPRIWYCRSAGSPSAAGSS